MTNDNIPFQVRTNQQAKRNGYPAIGWYYFADTARFGTLPLGPFETRWAAIKDSMSKQQKEQQ